MKGTAARIGGVVLGLVGMCSIAASLACGGGGGGGTIAPTFAASFTGSGMGAAPNVVRLRSASSTGNLVVVEVAISGATTSTDLYSFVFDLVLSDPTVASFVAGTDEIGDALTLSAGQTSRTQVSQQGNRVVVGASKFNGGLGNQVAAGESVILRLTFQVLKEGTTNVTFSGTVSAVNPSGGPAAVDHTGALVPSVQFDTLAAVITGT